MTPNYYETDNIGRAKYIVSFHDGTKTHRDGSPVYDLRIFKSLRARRAFVRGLVAQGYVTKGGRS